MITATTTKQKLDAREAILANEAAKNPKNSKKVF
jgi:hypothetical protein